MMIKYKLDVQEELKKRGYTSYVIRKNKYLSEGTLAKIKRGEPVNMKSLNAICCMLRKNIQDVIEIEITDEEDKLKIKAQNKGEKICTTHILARNKSELFLETGNREK